MALGIDVGSTGVLLVEDDDTHARLANPRPSRRTAAEVVSRMGDSVEIVHRRADGEVREDLAQSLFAEAARAAAQGAGVEPPSTGGLGIAVAVPAWWTTSALDLAGRELKERLGPRVQLVPDAVAAVMANPTVASTPREVVAVVDIGASTTSVALVADAGSPRPRLLARGDVAIGRSGDHLARLVMHHVIAGAQIDVRDLDGTDPRTAEQARDLLQQCEQAIQRLSHRSAVEIDTALGDHSIHVRLVRAELDEIGRSWSEDVVDRLRTQLQGCDTQVRRALLVGGAAHLPMFAQSISGELGLEVTVDPLPAAAFARGAARAGGSVDHRRAAPRRGVRPGPARRARGKVSRAPEAEAEAVLDLVPDDEVVPEIVPDPPVDIAPRPTTVDEGSPPAGLATPRRREIEAAAVDAPQPGAASDAGERPTPTSRSAPTEGPEDLEPPAETSADRGGSVSRPRASAPAWSQIRSEPGETQEATAELEDGLVDPPADDVVPSATAATAKSKRGARRPSLGRGRRAVENAPTDDAPTAIEPAVPVVEDSSPTTESSSELDDTASAKTPVAPRAGRRRGRRRTSPAVVPDSETDLEEAEVSATEDDDADAAPLAPVADNETAAVTAEVDGETTAPDQTDHTGPVSAPTPGRRRRGRRRAAPEVPPVTETEPRETLTDDVPEPDLAVPEPDLAVPELDSGDGAADETDDAPAVSRDVTEDEVADDETDTDENLGSGRTRRRRAGIVLLIVVVLVAAIAAWAYGAEREAQGEPPAAPSTTTPATSSPSPLPSPAADPTSVSPEPNRVDGSTERSSTPKPRSTGSPAGPTSPASQPPSAPTTGTPSSEPPVTEPPAPDVTDTPTSEPSTPSAETAAP